jgi:hypothetical protein
MPDTAQQVITESQGLLNDLPGTFYTFDSLLPYLNKAYRELQDYYNLHGLKTTVEVSSLIVVPANSEVLLNVPADLLRPITLSERTVGSIEQFTEMDERSWEPDEVPTTHLRIWTWREETVFFRGATEPRELRIRYVKSLSPLSGAGSFIGIMNSKSALAARTAALGARYIGENPTRADELDSETGRALDRLIVTAIRQSQGLPTRRRRTRYRVPN